MPDTPATTTSPDELAISDQTHETSQPFIGQWNQLISTTNWDKGEIICQWRSKLEKSGATTVEFSDEAWTRLVGGVSPQHVGRLRRTSERFGHVRKEYEGLYWSHFYAALDWDDAEMWLEGAVQNQWSISQMRNKRWETLGKLESDRHDHDGEIVTMEMQEEIQSLALSENQKRNGNSEYVEGPIHEGPDFGDEGPDPAASSSSSKSKSDATADAPENSEKPHQIRPFESFKNLPDDVMDAANQFKVCIIKHKLAEWEEIEKSEMLALLDAMKQLATIASE